MNISHADLESCRRNPAGWVSLKLRATTGGPRAGYDGLTKLAIYAFHRTGDRQQSLEHLRGLLERRDLRTAYLVERSMQRLDSYIDWIEGEQPAVALWKLRILLPLGSGWAVGGELSRVDIDLATGGYRALLIGTRPDDWRGQLRMPLLQRAVAEKMQRPQEEVSVGFQDLDGGRLEITGYSEADVAAAVNEAQQLAIALRSEWQRQGGADEANGPA